MSLRNIDSDLALNRLNELFFLHRYDDCVVFLNRLNHVTIKALITKMSIDVYLSRLPYTIEIFEALYSKLFIIDPDTFPIRNMQPERLIDKMISYFSLLADHNKLEPIDGLKILNSFENVIRVISYVQPNVYTRLLYFKYAIDNSLIRLERDLLHTSASSNFISSLSTGNSKGRRKSATIGSSHSVGGNGASQNLGFTNINVETWNTSLIMCDAIKYEVLQTIALCERASLKLNDYMANMKTQKFFKDARYYTNSRRSKINSGK
jgi:hypothetical protein